jgi:quinoprotein glucose dehydrogenase
MPSFAHLQKQTILAVTRYLLFGKDLEVAAMIGSPSPSELKYTNDGYQKFLGPDGYPAVEPPWGTLNAINLDTGEIVWKIPFGEFPELVEQGLRTTGSENFGGPVVTAGGVLFIAATSYDKKFRAFDKTTGRLLWESILPAAGNATPAVYQVKGREFVVIAAGGRGRPSGGTYLAFALPLRASDDHR